MRIDYPLIGIYEKALKPARFNQMFLDAVACGYDAFELSLDGTQERLARLDWNAKAISEVLKAASKNGIQILTTCLSAHKKYPLGSSNPDIVAKGIEIMTKAARLCGDLGIRIIQMSGFDVNGSEPSTKVTSARYLDNIAQCVRIAEHNCVMLAIEPVEGNLLTVKDTVKVVEEINSPWLKIYPDPANVCSLGFDPIKDILCGKGHIVAVHMRDSVPGNFDATIPFGTGDLDFDGVFNALNQISFNGPLVVEMWYAENDEYIPRNKQALQYLKGCIDKVGRKNV